MGMKKLVKKASVSKAIKGTGVKTLVSTIVKTVVIHITLTTDIIKKQHARLLHIKTKLTLHKAALAKAKPAKKAKLVKKIKAAKKHIAHAMKHIAVARPPTRHWLKPRLMPSPRFTPSLKPRP